jgi:hypothetical protein
LAGTTGLPLTGAGSAYRNLFGGKHFHLIVHFDVDDDDGTDFQF